MAIRSNSITFIDNTGVEKYLYVRYSNDGESFTENNGLTPGTWLGVCTTDSSVAPTSFNAYTWSLIKGQDGKDGIPGKDGDDGKTTYFHVKYSDVQNPISSDQMTEIPSKYIGTYVDYIEDDSVNPDDYKWIKFTGDDGIPGENGINGKTYYLHIKYSNDGGTSFTDNNGEDPGEYLGVYTDEIEEDSMDATKYTWSLIKGRDATTYYTWIKYADDDKGTGMDDKPEGKEYIGIAYNKDSAQESDVASEYTWSLIKGSNGVKGDDGVTYYTWIKYADDDQGNGIDDDPDGKKYIGIKYNQLTEKESNDPNAYDWVLFRGKDGIDGKNGVAGKGIKSITEYYLIDKNNTGIKRDDSRWDTKIPTLDKDNRYLWNYEETIFVIEELDAEGNITKREEIDTTEPIVIGVYGETGSSLQIKYKSSATTPNIIGNDVSEWSDTIPTAVSGQKVYMIQKLSTETEWSEPLQISAEDGFTPTVTISADGYWVINGEKSEFKAEGEDGDTPEITIGGNGNWVINNKDSGIKAQGEAGKDGTNIEYVYYHSKEEASNLVAPSYSTNGNLTTGWSQSPQGIDGKDYFYEYMSVRIKPAGVNTEWGSFSKPVIWSKWGVNGQDGDGVEYKYYLTNSTNPPQYPNIEDSEHMWTDDPGGVSKNAQYEYVVQIKTTDGGTQSTISDPALWAKYSNDGSPGSSLQIKYLVSTTTPTIQDNDVSKWSDAIPEEVAIGQKVYMTQKLSNETDWSTPIPISAVDGETPNVTIVEGYWYVNGQPTYVKAEGKDGNPGNTPKITVGSNGNWFIDGNDSGTKAQGEQGEAGKDGASVEYIYYLSKTAVTLAIPEYIGSTLPSGWEQSPKGVDETNQYEYVSVRTKPIGGDWGKFSTPVIWSKWGEKGMDGDGIEYKYYLSNSADVPDYDENNTQWSNDPQGVNEEKQYEYVVQIKTNSEGTTISSPKLWAKFGADGSDGNGIVSITNYYAVTETPNTPDDDKWEEQPPAMSNINKYLWNYESILYTNSSEPETTTPSIIGVYGDNGLPGVDAIRFAIYAPEGREFIDSVNESERVTSIKLNVFAFKGSDSITNATYEWSWFNPILKDGEGDREVISSNKEITIAKDAEYALANLTCTMRLDDGSEYYDYITLTKKTDFYTAEINFFNGNNVFARDQEFLAGYIQLYKNNSMAEHMPATSYSMGQVNEESGIITASVTNVDEDALMYFIYNTNGDYKIVLGKYNSGTWKVHNVETKYVYESNVNSNIRSNVFIVSKADITRSLNVDVHVYTDVLTTAENVITPNRNTLVAMTKATIIDLNDTVVSNQEPAYKYDGQMWFDTTEEVLKVYKMDESGQSGSWVPASIQQTGKTVYVEKPQSYNKGDLWIVEDGVTVESYIAEQVTQETAGDYYVFENNEYVLKTLPAEYNATSKYYLKFTYTAGTTLTAIADSKTADGSNEFNPTHWTAVNPTLINVQDNVMHYFKTNPETGLRIGQVNQSFYVNIDSKQMGFYVNNDLKVHVGVDSTSIKNLTVERSADFNCEVTLDNKINIVNTNTSTNTSFPGFVWQIEDDGGFSLVKMEV